MKDGQAETSTVPPTRFKSAGMIMELSKNSLASICMKLMGIIK